MNASYAAASSSESYSAGFDSSTLMIHVPCAFSLILSGAVFNSSLIAVTVPDLFGKGVPPRDKLQLGGVWMAMFVVVM